MKKLELDLIAQASSFLHGKIRRTPIEPSPPLSDLLGVPVYLKLESMQITGSFKVRGALFYLSTLSREEKEKGIAACSAGNHGLGVAYAAKEMGVKCTVYLPKNVDEAKKKKILKLGAQVRQSAFIGYDDTLLWAQSEAEKMDQHLISAFEDERIMAGNGGTIGAEIWEDIPDVKNVLFPVGGGGLGSGLSYFLKAKNPSIQLIGCQLFDSPALQLSLEAGEAKTSLPAIETIAGGIEGGIGAKCFAVLKERINEVSLVKEHEIKRALCWMLENHQYLIEPSAVVTVASCLSQRLPRLTGKTVVLLSGRNVAFSTIQELVCAPNHKKRD